MLIDVLLDGLQKIKQIGIDRVQIENTCFWVGKVQGMKSIHDVRGTYPDIDGFMFYASYNGILDITNYGYRYVGR